MSVHVRIPCSLRKFVNGEAELILPSGDMAQLFSYLEEHHGTLYESIHHPSRKTQPFVKIFVNQTEFSGTGRDTFRLRSGDVVQIVTAIAGG